MIRSREDFEEWFVIFSSDIAIAYICYNSDEDPRQTVILSSLYTDLPLLILFSELPLAFA
jgi:hypothetical protein